MEDSRRGRNGGAPISMHCNIVGCIETIDRVCKIRVSPAPLDGQQLLLLRGDAVMGEEEEE